MQLHLVLLGGNGMVHYHGKMFQIIFIVPAQSNGNYRVRRRETIVQGNLMFQGNFH